MQRTAMLVLAIAALWGCEAETIADWDDLAAHDHWAGGVEAARPGVPVPVVQSQPLIPGAPWIVDIEGAIGGETVHLVRGDGELTDGGPCLAGLGGLCLDLAGSVSRIGSPVMEPDGTASVTVGVVPALPGVELCVQGVARRGAGGSASVESNVSCETICSGADVSTLVEGDLLITEVMQNPSAVGDFEGEYFEVENTLGVDVNLAGLVVSDLDTDGFTVGGCPVAPAGERVVFARNADPALNGGFDALYEYVDFSLGNAGDEIILVADGTIVDAIAYDDGATFPDPVGASMELLPSGESAAGNDDGRNWCVAIEPFGAGDAGSPGAPLSAGDTDGDGIPDGCDACPAGDDTVDGDGDGVPNGCDPCPFDNPDDTDGDGVCDSDDPCPLDDTDDTDGDGVCDGDDPCPLDNPDDADGDGICDSDGPCDGVHISALSPGDLVITEIMQNPEAVLDADGEYFEIRNVHGADVNLDGLSVYDLDTDAFTVAGCTTVLAGDYFVFGKNGDMASNGGYTADYVFSGFDIGNRDDEIVLDAGGMVIDRVVYDDGPEFPDPVGASISLHPPVENAIDNDFGANWCASVSSYGDGDLGTPGAPNAPCGP